jgi:hypothetical protein
MKNLVSVFILVALVFLGCKRAVEFEDPTPEEVSSCTSLDFYQGFWISDSVWITTEVDTLDSLIVNKIPGITYVLEVLCNDTATNLDLIYVSNAGVQTLDVRSSNFNALDTAIHVFGQLDSIRAEPEFRMSVLATSDTTLTGSFSTDLGNGQRSNYQLFLRR